MESIVIVNKPENNSINVGETYESLGAKEMPTDVWADVEWSSSDESIAEIYYDYVKGRVVLIGKSKGSVWIGVESSDGASDASDGFWLNVEHIPVEKFWIDCHPEHTGLEDCVTYVGEIGFLQVDIYPKDPNVYYNEIEWYVSEGDSNSVRFEATAEKDSIRVYALKPGNIEISAIIDDSIVAEISYPLEIRIPSSIITVPTNRIVKNGTEYTFNADIRPEYAIGTWNSSNINVGTIDSNGVFKALSNGETEITLSYKVGRITYSHTEKICVSDIDN